MRTKYLSKANFWVLPIDNNYFGTMKSILRQRDITATIRFGVIISGEDTDLCFDHWINDKSLVKLIGWNRVYLSNTSISKVSHIIRDPQFQPQLLSETKEVATQTVQVKLFSDKPTDYWKIGNQGKFV